MSQNPPPASTGPCPDCGADRVPMSCPTEMHLMRGGPAVLYPVCGLRAIVCTGCGRTTLYAAEPARIRSALQKHPHHFQR